jgi:hypothetical protein
VCAGKSFAFKQAPSDPIPGKNAEKHAAHSDAQATFSGCVVRLAEAKGVDEHRFPDIWMACIGSNRPALSAALCASRLLYSRSPRTAGFHKPAEVLDQICKWADLEPSEIVARFAKDLPRVNEAVINPLGSGDGLRYPDAVRGAMERLPQLRTLESHMATFRLDKN